MKKNGTKLMMALGLFCLCHVNAADEMDSVGNLHDIFECYSASNWYGKSKKCYSGLVKQWPLSFPAMLRPVYHERAKSSGGTRDVFLLSDAGNTNQLVRLEIALNSRIGPCWNISRLVQRYSHSQLRQMTPAALEIIAISVMASHGQV